LLEKINIHCFKSNIDEIDFIDKIEQVLDLADDLEVPLQEIPFYINQKKAEILKLDKEIENRRQKIGELIEDYNITINDLEEYRLNQPLLNKIDKLKDIINNKDEQIYKIRKKMLENKAKIMTPLERP
jgi:hypothetical protein